MHYRNKPKQERLCNSMHLGQILYSHCCPRQCIAQHLNETPCTIEEHLKLWSGLPQNVLTTELAKLLSDAQVNNILKMYSCSYVVVRLNVNQIQAFKYKEDSMSSVGTEYLCVAMHFSCSMG